MNAPSFKSCETMKNKLVLVLRLIVLVVLYFLCFATVSSALFQLPAEQPTSAEANPALALLVVSCLNTVLLSYLIIRSRWAGLKLIGAIFLIFFGVSTFMPQIETAYFITRLPSGMLPRLFLAGAITAALFSPLAVLVLGKRRHEGPDEEGSSRLNMPLRRMGLETVSDCSRLPRHILHLRLLHRMEKSRSPRLLRRKRSGKLPGADGQRAAGHALACAASSCAGHALDCFSRAGHTHDERSLVADWISSWAAVCGTKCSIANTLTRSCRQKCVWCI